MLWSITNKAELYYCSLLCYLLACTFWRPANSNECCFGYHCRRRASDCCNIQRGSRNKLISHLFYNVILNPSRAASSNPFQRGSRGWGVFIHQNHCAGGENGSIMVGKFVCLCSANQNLFEREFFVPTRMDLGVKLLRNEHNYDGCGRPCPQLHPAGETCVCVIGHGIGGKHIPAKMARLAESQSLE